MRRSELGEQSLVEGTPASGPQRPKVFRSLDGVAEPADPTRPLFGSATPSPLLLAVEDERLGYVRGF